MKKNFKMELNPLFRGPSLESRNKTGSPYRVIPLSEIDVDPNQPRRNFSQEAIEELAASIKEYGVMNPILVSPTAGGTYRIIAGERRYRASKLLGLEAIPAIVDTDEEGGEQTTLAKQLVENLQREDLSSLERATAIGQLRDHYGWSVREIAAKLGTSKSLVQRSFDVLALPDDLQGALAQGHPESKVLLLAQVEDKELRRELTGQLDELSREQLELKIRALLGGEEEREVSHGGTGKRRSPVLSAADRAMVDQIQKTLGTKVLLVRSSAKGETGKLIVEFYSREDLDDLHRRLVS